MGVSGFERMSVEASLGCMLRGWGVRVWGGESVKEGSDLGVNLW